MPTSMCARTLLPAKRHPSWIAYCNGIKAAVSLQEYNCRPARLLKDPSPELRIPGAATQTRVVCVAGIRFGSGESAQAFKGIICDEISEFESSLPSHAVRSL
jgi:hypothetical protein